MRRTHALLHAARGLAARGHAVRGSVAVVPPVPEAHEALVARIREIAAAVVPATAGAEADDDVGRLGWDSLARVRVHVALETALGVLLEPEALAAQPLTLRGLAAAVAVATTESASPANGGDGGLPLELRAGAHASLAGKLARELLTLRWAVHPRINLVRHAMRLLPSFTLPAVRSRLLRLAGCDIARSTAVLGRPHLLGKGDVASRLHIGRGCIIGPEVTFGLDADITIGDNVSVSPFAVLYTATHELGLSSRRMTSRVTARPVVVEDGVWIGMGAMVLAGSRIGRGCVVSAGAVVSGDVPADTLVAGNPAVVVDRLPAEEA